MKSNNKYTRLLWHFYWYNGKLYKHNYKTGKTTRIKLMTTNTWQAPVLYELKDMPSEIGKAIVNKHPKAHHFVCKNADENKSWLTIHGFNWRVNTANNHYLTVRYQFTLK